MTKQTTDIIWDWKAASTRAAGGHSTPRTRFWVQAGVMAAVGVGLFHFTDHRIVPCFLWVLTGLLLAGLLFSEPILHGFDRFGVWLARAVGCVLTWGLLTPFFFIVFGLGRFIISLTGKDPLQRKLDPQAASYWTDRAGVETKSRYQKQF